MGLFSGKTNASNTWATQRADEQDHIARDEARNAEKYRKSLQSGKSDDPAADRYLMRQHDSARGIAEANARDLRKIAEQDRGLCRWFGGGSR